MKTSFFRKSQLIMTLIFIVGLVPVAHGHGSIELIECTDEKAKLVLRGEETATPNKLDFVFIKDYKKISEHKNISLTLKDTNKGDLIIENISFEIPKTGKALLQIEEYPTRLVRDGKGELEFSNGFSGTFRCFAVY